MYLQVNCPVDGNGLIWYELLIERCTLTGSSRPTTTLNLCSRHRHFTLHH